MSRIITDKSQLRLPCTPVKDRNDGGQIARRLQETLEQHNKRDIKRCLRNIKTETLQVPGIGLAATQIGIQKAVCLIYVRETPLVLMNPIIVEHSSVKIPFNEGCLSLPGQRVDTWRYVWVKIEALNLRTPLTLGPTNPGQMNETSLLRSVVAQHEIAHLFGLLVEDFANEDYPPPAEWPNWRPAEIASAEEASCRL